MPFHNRIIGNFMVYQDRLEANLLQLFAHPENSEWFSIISGIIFEVNVVSAQSKDNDSDFFVFYKLPSPSILLLPPTAVLTYLAPGIQNVSHCVACPNVVQSSRLLFLREETRVGRLALLGPNFRNCWPQNFRLALWLFSRIDFAPYKN